MLDVAIIGSGPAGVAAAINVRQRNRSLVLLGAAEVSRKLESAQEIANYPGFPESGGAALGEAAALGNHCICPNRLSCAWRRWSDR